MAKTPSTSRRYRTPEALQAWQEFVSFLKARNDRITQPRRIILDTLFDHPGHFSAEQLAADLARGGNRVSRGTIYRTLGLLTEAGLLRRVHGVGVHTYYEHVPGRERHGHMVCNRCGQLIEFDTTAVTTELRRACRQQNFVSSGHSVTIFGTCESCRRMVRRPGNKRENR